MTPLDAVTASDRNVLAAFAAVIPHVGRAGEIQFFGGAACVFSGADHPFFNRIFVQDRATSIDDIVAAIGYVRERQREPSIQVRHDLDRRLRRRIRELGFEPAEWVSPGMALDPIPAATPPPSGGLRFEQLSGGEGAADRMNEWHTVAGSGTVLRQALPASVLEDPAMRFVTGYDAEGPVCNSFVIRSEREIGIYGVGTLERARKRGYGTAATWAAIEAGRAAWGLEVAVLQSSEMGFGVYSKMGFVEACRYVEYYVTPAEPEAAAPQG